MDIDRAFVTRMIDEGAVPEVAEERITTEMLLPDTPARRAFAFSMKFLLEYGTSPTAEIVKREVPEFRPTKSKHS